MESKVKKVQKVREDPRVCLEFLVSLEWRDQKALPGLKEALAKWALRV